jgi:hypothetical protein
MQYPSKFYWHFPQKIEKEFHKK